MHCTPSVILFFIGGFMKSISLLNFLQNYYGIVSEDLKLNNLTHMDIKILFPFIKRSSFESMDDNLYEIYNGNLILVYDSKGNVLPYINPHLEVSFVDRIYDEYKSDTKIDMKVIDLDSLSKEELIKLRKKLKQYHQYIEEKDVVKAIRKKKDYKVMQYKKEKNELKWRD